MGKLSYIQLERPNTFNGYYTAGFTFIVTEMDTGKLWIVPEGYKSDGASIPKKFEWLIGSDFRKEFLEAAYIHDWYYDVAYYRFKNEDMYEKYPASNHALLETYVKLTDIRSQKETHGIFKDILKQEGVPWWKRTLMHQAVKLHGFLKNRGWK